MVDTSATMVPLPLHFTQKILSTMKHNKNGKGDDEKTFNRYVRQLVDQYLDKEVVISKQPEDKVELIVQACRDKFPEYAHWTTTRIRIYIESCRRLKKIKNSPILLAKRKAAGRRFREGQKLKKMISSQLNLHAAESQRHLAEYLLKSNGIKEEPVPIMTPAVSQSGDNSAFKTVYSSNSVDTTNSLRGVQIQTQPSSTTESMGPIFKPITSLCTPITSLCSSAPTTLDSSALSSIMQLAPQLIKVQSMADAASQPEFISTTPILTPQALNPIFTTPFKQPLSPISTISSPSSVLSLSSTSPVMAPSQTSLSPNNLTTSLSPSHNLHMSGMSPNSSPLKPTINISEPASVSPPLSDSFLISAAINNCGISQTRLSPRLSPKIKSFQIDSLINMNNTTKTLVDERRNILDKPLFPIGSGLSFSDTPVMTMSEILNAKTLVTSYREAANFLYRAATELEQLLPGDHKVF